MSKRIRETFVFLALSALLVVLIFFAPSFGPRTRQFLSGESVVPESENLVSENESLRAELVVLQLKQSELGSEPHRGIVASVYSEYPFGARNELTINEGTARGIAAGDVVFAGGILIGKITRVSPGTAIVTTIFDDNFSLAVRAASSGVNGLLIGGNRPLVSSIEKTANVAAGDIVISAATGFPYGAPLGVLGTPVLSENSLFLEAPLVTAYDLGSIKAVTVLVN